MAVSVKVINTTGKEVRIGSISNPSAIGRGSLTRTMMNHEKQTRFLAEKGYYMVCEYNGRRTLLGKASSENQEFVIKYL